METIMPVTYEDTLIGYMQIGQFRDKEEKFSSPNIAQRLLEKYKINTKTALKLYDELPIVSQEKLSSLQEILLILIKHFWEEGLIHHNRSMLSIKIEQFVQERIKEKLTVSTLCEQFYLSKNSLYNLFATEFNSTVSDYVLNKRIQNSIKMLKESDFSITMIAAECGFTDYNYFIRAFKKHVGITPLQFRKTNTP
jgi:AraC-like DNA-binding protein